jgi:hypothetical protein
MPPQTPNPEQGQSSERVRLKEVAAQTRAAYDSALRTEFDDFGRPAERTLHTTEFVEGARQAIQAGVQAQNITIEQEIVDPREHQVDLYTDDELRTGLAVALQLTDPEANIFSIVSTVEGIVKNKGEQRQLLATVDTVTTTAYRLSFLTNEKTEETGVIASVEFAGVIDLPHYAAAAALSQYPSPSETMIASLFEESHQSEQEPPAQATEDDIS